MYIYIYMYKQINKKKNGNGWKIHSRKIVHISLLLILENPDLGLGAIITSLSSTTTVDVLKDILSSCNN